MLKIFKKMKKDTNTAADITTTGVNALIAFWKQENENIEDIQLAENARALQLDFENLVVALKQNKNTAQLNKDRAVRNSQSRPDAKEIVQMSIKVRLAEKEYDEAILVYTTLFGESPKFV